jgi:folate-dependent phosphoribosylglycinamide formyltransferase PurN
MIKHVAANRLVNKDGTPLSWLVLFSATGSEIANISDKLGIKPDKILTDNFNTDKHDKRIKASTYWRVKGITYEQKLNSYRNFFKDYDVITLHGWLNIIPKEICREFKIYNGHPGLINYYPDLKGKDPQVRAYDRIGNYLYVGSVIHEVTEYIDCGRIICYDKVHNVHCVSLDETYKALKQTSLNTWIDFFTNQRYNIVC